MKQTLARVVDATRTAMAAVKTWFDPPLGSDAEPLEIREAIIYEIEQRAEPAGGGRRVLPYNQISVTVLAPGKHERARLQAALEGLRDAVCARLGEIQCSRPGGFAIDVRYIKRRRSDWSHDQRLSVDYSSHAGERTTTGGALGVPRLRVTVVRGQATQTSYTLAEPHVHIGRSAQPVDGRGRSRRNHVVFVEDGDEHSRTVGRAHASIHYDAERAEYRLFDDGSHNGTRVVRDGVTLDVVPRDPVGVTLKSGDEIQLGTAALRVQLD